MAFLPFVVPQTLSETGKLAPHTSNLSADTVADVQQYTRVPADTVTDVGVYPTVRGDTVSDLWDGEKIKATASTTAQGRKNVSPAANVQVKNAVLNAQTKREIFGLSHYISSPSRSFNLKADINGVTYDSSSLVEFTIDELGVPDQDLVLGAVLVGKLTMKLKTADVIPNNASIKPGIQVNDGYGGLSDWFNLRNYYIDTRNHQNGVWSFTCYDALITSEQEYKSSLTFPVSMKAVWDELMNQLGLDSDSSVVINPAYMIPYKPDGLYTIRQMLGFIASAHAANVKLTEADQVAFIKYPTSYSGATAVTPADYSKQNKTNYQKNFTSVLLTYNDDGETLVAGSGDVDHTFNIFNPFMDQAMLNTVFNQLNGLSYMPFTMDWRSRPDLPICSPITVTERDGNTYNTLIMNNSMKFTGGLRSTINAPSSSKQRSEFNYKGTIKDYIAGQITSKAVNLDDSYYGVTIGRSNGIKIKKSDGVSEAIFNSDTLKMTRSGASIFEVNSEGWLELTGVKIKGGTITWGTGGVNPPTADQVGALPKGWTPDLSSYVTTGALSATLGSYLTNSQLTTQLGQDYIVTGKIAANQIVAGTFTGFTIIGGTIKTAASGARLEMSNNTLRSYNASEYMTAQLLGTGLYFYGQLNGSSCGRIDGGNGRLQIHSDNAIDFNVGTGWPVTVTSSELLVDKISMQTGNKIYIGDYGAYLECASDGLRLHTDASNYIHIDSGVIYGYTNGTSKQLAP